MLTEDVLWTLDDCDDADLSPESKRALGLDEDTRMMLESGEVPVMSEERARALLEEQPAPSNVRRIRAA